MVEKEHSAPFTPRIKSAVAGRADYSGLETLLTSNQRPQVILVRHGTTTQNSRVERLLKQPGTTLGDWIDLQSDPGLIDADLTAEGVEQCSRAGDLIRNHRFDAVFISPMTRTLHSAHLLFRDNCGFDDMDFFVHPLLREKVHVSADLLSTHDLQKRVAEWQTRFGTAKLSLCPSSGWELLEG